MEIAYVSLTVAYFVWSAIALWRKDGQISRCMELLAARSFGEYATGKAKIANPKPDETFDPGF